MKQQILLSILCFALSKGNEHVYGDTDSYDGATRDSMYDVQTQKRYDGFEDRYAYEAPRSVAPSRKPSTDSLTSGYRSSYDKKQGNTFDSRRTWKARPAPSTSSYSEYYTQGRNSGEYYNRRSNNKGSNLPTDTPRPSSATSSRYVQYNDDGTARSEYQANRTSLSPRTQIYSHRDSYEPSNNYDTYSQASHQNGNSYGHGYRPSARKPKSHLGLFVAPLASIAFLATAAALAASPSFVTFSTAGLFGRKRRALETEVDPTVANSLTPELKRKLEELQTLEKYMSTIPAETAHQQQVMSMYLSCSGYMEHDNQCMDRVFCEYGNAKSTIAEEERDVLSIILYNIMANKHVKEDYKDRLRVAARLGRDTQRCQRYQCVELNDEQDN